LRGVALYVVVRVGKTVIKSALPSDYVVKRVFIAPEAGLRVNLQLARISRLAEGKTTLFALNPSTSTARAVGKGG
jgi:hypothetical protein